MTTYKVIPECRSDGKMPIISPFVISKDQYDQIQKIVHETQSRKNGGKYR